MRANRCGTKLEWRCWCTGIHLLILSAGKSQLNGNFYSDTLKLNSGRKCKFSSFDDRRIFYFFFFFFGVTLTNSSARTDFYLFIDSIRSQEHFFFRRSFNNIIRIINSIRFDKINIFHWQRRNN